MKRKPTIKIKGPKITLKRKPKPKIRIKSTPKATPRRGVYIV